jgi:hypothetical protein
MEKETVLTARSYFGGSCRVKFTEDGYEILSDDREVQEGYLHVYPESAEAITEACRDQIIKYFYSHDVWGGEPGLGASPQTQYFGGLSLSDREAIGNKGERGLYA